MAQLVLGLGSSHTPMLNTRADDWKKFEERDAEGRFLDQAGDPATYEQLLARADPRMPEWITPALMTDRFEAAQDHVRRLGETIEAAALDALIVVGDDQHELYFEDNLPSILVYYGDTIRNLPRHLDKPNKLAWFQDARAGYYQPEPTDYPVHRPLAEHLIASLVDDAFDVSTADRLRDGQGEGHAFAFVHSRLMPRRITPIIPLALNTYYPPNQPTPRRCYNLGRSIRAAVESFPGEARVGILASGGLSHFTVDEDLDRGLIEAMRNRDAEALSTVERKKLNSGSSEIRNWICTAGAVEHLTMSWVEYLPCYRTPAGTGTGMCFAEWR